MITNEEKSLYLDINESQLNDAFIDNCIIGKLEHIHYLLTSPELKINVDIHTKNDNGLFAACTRGHLNIVKYLLASSDLKEHINIHTNDDFALFKACQFNHVNIVKYLLTSSDLKEHGNIHIKDNYPIKFLLNNGSFVQMHGSKDCSGQHLEIMKHLIFKKNIAPPDKIEKYPNVIRLFELKKLNDSLHLKLNNKNSEKIKVKI